MRLASILTPHGPRVTIATADGYVDLHATDPGLPKCMKSLLPCGPGVSARHWQFRGEEKQWIIGQPFDTFAPTGPVLVTADELTDPHNLKIQLRLYGTTLQSSSTKEFIFGVPHLLWFLSQVVT